MLGKKKITESDIEEVKTISLITYLEKLGYKPEYKYGDRAMFLSPLRAESLKGDEQPSTFYRNLLFCSHDPKVRG